MQKPLNVSFKSKGIDAPHLIYLSNSNSIKLCHLSGKFSTVDIGNIVVLFL